MKATLYTRQAANLLPSERAPFLVTEFEMPPFQLLPELAVWGSRAFVLKKPFSSNNSGPTEPVYFEVCGWSVDASKSLEELAQGYARRRAAESNYGLDPDQNAGWIYPPAGVDWASILAAPSVCCQDKVEASESAKKRPILNCAKCGRAIAREIKKADQPTQVDKELYPPAA